MQLMKTVVLEKGKQGHPIADGLHLSVCLHVGIVLSGIWLLHTAWLIARRSLRMFRCCVKQRHRGIKDVVSTAAH